MVDTLAFLKNDYSEEEIHKIVDRVNNYVKFFGGYGAVLLKTTDATIYRERKENIEVPEEAIIGKLPADLLAVRQKLNEKKAVSPAEYFEYMTSGECNELLKKESALTFDYLTEHDGFTFTKYEANKYVINARLNISAHSDFAVLLDNMGIEFTDIVQWWSNDFDPETAFELIEYKPKEFDIDRYNFCFAENYSDDEIDTMLSIFAEVLEQAGYGIYDILSGDVMRAVSDTVIKVPVPDEYAKYEDFKENLSSELWKKYSPSENFDMDVMNKIRDAKKKETEAYLSTHHIFDERAIKQGQIVLSIDIVDEDVDTVKEIIESVGYPLEFLSLDDSESISNDDFECI